MHPYKIEEMDAPQEESTTIVIPDRLSSRPDSPHFNKEVIPNIDVYFRGKKRMGDVAEYCISEGWIRIELRNARNKLRIERGKIMTMVLRGPVEVVLK